MMNKIKIIARTVFIAIFISGFAQAETYVTGVVVEADNFTTWTLSESPYIATGTIEVKGTLTIEPGVEVRFGTGSEMLISGTGILIAKGTKNAYITFTSHQDTHTKGHWNYIKFNWDCSKTSIFEYCHIEYGGSDKLKGNIYCETYSANSITPFILSTCTISYGSASGVYYQQSDLIAQIYDCTIKDNESYPVVVGAMLDMKGNIFSENGVEAIKILSSFFSGISRDIIWRNQGIPFNVSSDLLIGDMVAAGTLTIDAGVTVKFDNNQSLIIGPRDLGSNGCLRAEYVTFTSNSPIPNPGAWGYIKFDGLSQNSYLKYCKVEYAGNDITGAKPAIWCVGSAPEISYVNISNVYSHGIMCDIDINFNPASSTITYTTIVAGTALYIGDASAIYSYNSSPWIGSSTLKKSKYGILCTSSNGYFPKITNSNIIGNSLYGIYNENPGYGYCPT